MTSGIDPEVFEKIKRNLGDVIKNNYLDFTNSNEELVINVEVPCSEVIYLDAENKPISKEEFYSLKDVNLITKLIYNPNTRILIYLWEEKQDDLTKTYCF